ncbi:hypothetical protein L596_015958 [Steinernema carpocapsae]|uniref:Uncharacterized protein n=1 Tax=Steinernema carpocapsae TaxID=34508 RepID=A0A4U5NGJ0_STECR|nr:hypothetical protein L596_015958 [Steinernema carpocapsae]
MGHCHITWIFIIIFGFIITESVLIPLIIGFLTNPWVQLVSIGILDPQFLPMLLSSFAQLLTCLLGLIAMATGVKKLIYYYYGSMVLFIFVEIFLFFTWIFRLTAVHDWNQAYLAVAPQIDGVDIAVCEIWGEISDHLNCSVPSFCLQEELVALLPSNNSSGLPHCVQSFSKWLQFETQAIQFLTFFAAFPLKIWILFTSRYDVKVLFDSWKISGHPYTSWGTDEEEGFERPEKKQRGKISLFLKNLRKKCWKTPKLPPLGYEQKPILSTQRSTESSRSSDSNGRISSGSGESRFTLLTIPEEDISQCTEL